MNGLKRINLLARPFLVGLTLVGGLGATRLGAQNQGTAGTPRFAVVGSPTPIASSTPPVLSNPATDPRNGSPRLLDLDGPPVISTTRPAPQKPSLTPGTVLPLGGANTNPTPTGAASPAGANSTQPSIVQTQNSLPVMGGAPSGWPRSGGAVQPGYPVQPANPTVSKPGFLTNLETALNKPFAPAVQTVAPPTITSGGAVSSSVSPPSTGGRIIPMPTEGAPVSQTIVSGPGTVYPSTVQGTSQPWFGQKLWDWMNPPTGNVGVTTLPVAPYSETFVGGSSYPPGTIISEGPMLVGSQGGEYIGPGGVCEGGRAHSQGKFFFDAELLLWFISGQEVPALVTQGSVADPRPGALGQPGTSILYGGSYLPNDFAPGGRFTAGYWFGQNNIIGIDGQYFFLGQVQNTSVFQGFGNTQTVGRPFENALTGVQQAQQVYQPAVSPNPLGNSIAGTVTVKTMEQFDGATANLRWGLIRRPRMTTDIQTGFRWQQFNEFLSVEENLANTSPGAKGGFLVSDQFQTFNNFYGGNFSALNTFYLGRLSFVVNGKLGVGITNQSAVVNGYTVINDNGTISAYPGGLLTQKSNIGSYQQSVFTVIPELELNIGYQIAQRWRIFVGYNLIYWNNVARPGNLIDTVVNPDLVPPPSGTTTGPQRPTFQWANSDALITGANLGFEFKY